jgi:hypothetical protein
MEGMKLIRFIIGTLIVVGMMRGLDGLDLRGHPSMPDNIPTPREIVAGTAMSWEDIWRYGGPYGVYCGIFHSSHIFEEPINSVDRACQLHDTCISAAGKYLSCECNEQLLRRMSEVCPKNETDGYYRDQIIRAMNIGVSMCGSATCNLMDRYDVSHEIGYNAIVFYGPKEVRLSSGHGSSSKDEGRMLIGIIPTQYVTSFGYLNLIGKPQLTDFKKFSDGRYKVTSDESLIVFNLANTSNIFYAHDL